MEWTEIEARIASGEDARTELKRGLDLKQAGRAIAAFANSDGGVLILGVSDAGAIVGVGGDAEATSEKLSAFLQSGLGSPVMARLGRHRTETGWVHWIEVPRQRGYEPLRHGGRVYVRHGRASAEPSPQELQELFNRFGYIVTEEQTIAETRVADIDEIAFERFMRRLGLDLEDEPRLALEDDLATRGVLSSRGGETLATLYGLLAFGKRPQQHPQTTSFWLECVAYDGVDRADPVRQVAEARGRVDEQVDRALDWLRGLPRREEYGDVVREDLALVPLVAAREALVNAVCHRDYAITGSRILLEVFDDRVVVTSPGTLPNHMTPSSAMAGGHPRSRNELVANFMQVMGFMEGRGRGWPRIRRALRERGGPAPTLVEDRGARWVRVTLPVAR